MFFTGAFYGCFFTCVLTCVLNVCFYVLILTCPQKFEKLLEYIMFEQSIKRMLAKKIKVLNPHMFAVLDKATVVTLVVLSVSLARRRG